MSVMVMFMLWHYNSAGQSERSLLILTKIHENHPTDIDTLGALISFYQNLGKRKNVLIYARKLQILVPGNPQLEALILSLDKDSH